MGDTLERVNDTDHRANKPTKGAVEPMVAKPLTPRFNSACTMASERSSARFEASISSPQISVLN